MNETPAKSSLSEYRAKVDYGFFKDIWLNDLGQKSTVFKRFKGLRIQASDGDQLDLPASKDVLLSGYRGAHAGPLKETHSPKMYTVQVVDVLNGVVIGFSQRSESSEVHQARDLVGEFEEKSLTIYDRLHGKFLTMKAHADRGSFFLIRLPAGGQQMSVEFKDFLESRERKSKWLDYLPTLQRQSGATSIRIRLLKIRHPKTKEIYLFATNLAETFTIDEITGLYQRRWEVEVNFRDLTSTLKMNDWRSEKINGILQEIYTLFWLVNQVRLTCQMAVLRPKAWLKKEYRKPNLKLACELFIDNLDLLLTRPRRFRSLINYWIKRSTERRWHLSRSYPRQVKRFGKKYKNASTVKRRPA